MLTADGPKVIEFNVRFGDPEAQVVLPLLPVDLAPLLLSAAAGQLAGDPLPQPSGARVGVVLASGGYPGAMTTGHAITGIDAAEDRRRRWSSTREPAFAKAPAGKRRTKSSRPGGGC